MAETVAQRVGRAIQKQRARLGMTQAQLAERSEIATTEISKLENGHRSPRLETLERVAAALRVPMGTLFEDTPSEEDEFAAILSRLRGQSPEMLRRVVAVVDALVRVG